MAKISRVLLCIFLLFTLICAVTPVKDSCYKYECNSTESMLEYILCFVKWSLESLWRLLEWIFGKNLFSIFRCRLHCKWYYLNLMEEIKASAVTNISALI